MPLPWRRRKKNKGSRISRMVADLQPPNRGNSFLVVQTGFPTSLVDLFIKNRKRPKKPRSSKNSKNEEMEFIEYEEHEELAISNPILLSSSRDLAFEVENTLEPKCLLGKSRILEVGNETSDCNDKVSDGVKKRCNFLDAMKMFLVVVLALSTKQLAVGVTLSAFMLILIRYVGVNVFGFLRLCRFDAGLMLRPWIKRVSFLFYVDPKISVVQKPATEEQEEDDSSNESCWRSYPCNFVQETPVAQSYLNVVTQVDEDRRELIRGDNDVGCDLMTKSSEEIMEVEVERVEVSVSPEEVCGRRAKTKSKFMKKFVPKKFHGITKLKVSRMKESDFSRNASNCCLEEEKSVRIKELEEEPKHGSSNSINESQMVLEANSLRLVICESKKIRRKAHLGIAVLILIILAGLAGGRVLAALFTVSSCLVLKLIERSRQLKPGSPTSS